jgi:hypothetical protein
MSYVQRGFVLVAAIGSFFVAIEASRAVSLNFAGSQMDVGGTFYPNGATPPCCIVPWRSDYDTNVFAVSNEAPNRYYGTAGYALFATRFDYPDQNLGYFSTVSDPIFADNDLFIDMLNLPSFVTDSQILATHKAGGWAYALIDDPVLQQGYREWTFDGVNYPPAAGPCPGESCNVTGGIPYVKLGLLTGSDLLGNNPAVTPTGRWGFEVGEGAPAKFRVGVMTDGLDGTVFAAAEVFLTHAVNDVPVATISSGQVARNRFVDIHFFDITGAQAGDQFAFSAMKGAGDPDWSSVGISGFTFDIFPAAAVPGDYNNDGTVNAADYTVWRDHLGQTFQLDNEGAGQTEGQVTSEDYDFWKSQFSAGGGGASAIGVPEPATAGLLFVAAALGGLARRRR